MGNAVLAPVTKKESGDGAAASKGLSWGHSCMQGWRLQMEDAHFALEDLGGGGWAGTAAFGVMDGHGGCEVARFCELHLPREIARGPGSDYRNALVDAFHGIDKMLREEEHQETLRSMTPPAANGVLRIGPRRPCARPEWVGCTAVVCLVRRDVVVVANAGDSRAVLCRSGLAVPLSEDHKPNLPGERDRINKAGGCVERQQVGPIVQYRVNGNLNLSRSIGDLEYKRNQALPPSEQIIIATPDVHTYKREADDEFIIVACDGIWDVVGSQDAVDFVRDRLPRYRGLGMTLSVIMEELLDYCISPDLSTTSGLGGDNMTALLIVFDDAAAGLRPADTNRDCVPEEGSPAYHIPGSPDAFASVETRAIRPDSSCGCMQQLFQR